MSRKITFYLAPPHYILGMGFFNWGINLLTWAILLSMIVIVPMAIFIFGIIFINNYFPYPKFFETVFMFLFFGAIIYFISKKLIQLGKAIYNRMT